MTYPHVSEVRRHGGEQTVSRLSLVPNPADPAIPSLTGNPALSRAVNLAIWSRWISAAIRVSQLPQG